MRSASRSERRVQPERCGRLIDPLEIEPGLGPPAVRPGGRIAFEREDRVIADEGPAELDAVDEEAVDRDPGRLSGSSGAWGRLNGSSLGSGSTSGPSGRTGVRWTATLAPRLLDMDLAREQPGRVHPTLALSTSSSARVVGEAEAAEPDVERQEAFEIAHLAVDARS
jgi:hypothetical protein